MNFIAVKTNKEAILGEITYKNLLTQALSASADSYTLRLLTYFIDRTAFDPSFMVNSKELLSCPEEYQYSSFKSPAALIKCFENLFALEVLVPITNEHGYTMFKLNLNKVKEYYNIYDLPALYIFNALFDKKVISPKEYYVLLYLLLLRRSTKPVTKKLDTIDEDLGVFPTRTNRCGIKRFLTILMEVDFLFILPKYTPYNRTGKDIIKLNVYSISSLYFHIIKNENKKFANRIQGKLRLKQKLSDKYTSLDSLITDIEKVRAGYRR